MAQQIYCASDDGNAAVVMITMIETGQTDGFCGPCFQLFAAGIALAAGIVAELPGEPVPDAKPKRSRKRGTEPGPAVTPQDLETAPESEGELTDADMTAGGELPGEAP